MAHVTQVMLYVTQRTHIGPINAEWAKAFPRPNPTRATVIVILARYRASQHTESI